MDEKWEDMHRCPICRSWYEVNEEMASYRHRCKGEPVKTDGKKVLDVALEKLKEKQVGPS